MGYRHITNLYKDQTVLMFKRLIAMEKIHGTSTHLTFTYNGDIFLKEPYYTLDYFSGGEKHENFISLFDKERLEEKALALGFNTNFTIYGEGYGGKQQGMSGTYGKESKFIAFEVKIGDRFQNVEWANIVCNKMGLEFVHWEEIDADPELIDKLANSPSVQAKRNGVENPELPREGVILRPLREFLHPDGVGRIMAKHKNDIYKEREHAPKLVDPEKLKMLEDANAIAEEWVVLMRLEHVIDKLKADGVEIDMKNTNYIIKAMIEDVFREAKDEIVESKEVRKSIGKKTVKILQQWLKDRIL